MKYSYKRVRDKLWKIFEGKCENCGVGTVIMGVPLRAEEQPSNLATIDHLYCKHHPLRLSPRKEGERRIFLFCRACNTKKNESVDRFWATVYPKTKLLTYPPKS